jgi:hypothetical protein
VNFYEDGYRAQKAGLPRVAAILVPEGTQVGKGSWASDAKEWYRGWDVANLEDE